VSVTERLEVVSSLKKVVRLLCRRTANGCGSSSTPEIIQKQSHNLTPKTLPIRKKQLAV
jgi:hypothetical protein